MAGNLVPCLCVRLLLLLLSLLLVPIINSILAVPRSPSERQRLSVRDFPVTVEVTEALMMPG